MSNYENRMQRDLVTDAIVTESNEEFILPDYMPEIGRVLRVSATLLPDEPFPETGGTEFSGGVAGGKSAYLFKYFLLEE